jgi:hypothetical protein
MKSDEEFFWVTQWERDTEPAPIDDTEQPGDESDAPETQEE